MGYAEGLTAGSAPRRLRPKIIRVVAAGFVAVLAYAYGPRTVCFVACASCNTTGRGELSNENPPRPGLDNDGDKASDSEALNPRVPGGAHGVRVGDQLIEAQVGNVDDLAEREASLAGGGVLDAAPARGQ